MSGTPQFLRYFVTHAIRRRDLSPPNFEHSRAFDEVAQGLHLALLALGHDSELTNCLDLDERRTIVLAETSSTGTA